MDNLFENEVQIKALNGQVEEELIFPKTKVGLVKDLNSFSKIKIGDNGVTAVGYDSTLEFIAGNGINIISNNVLKNINILTTICLFVNNNSYFYIFFIKTHPHNGCLSFLYPYLFNPFS